MNWLMLLVKINFTRGKLCVQLMGLDSYGLQVEVTGVYAFVVSLFSSVNNVCRWAMLREIATDYTSRKELKSPNV